MFSKCIWLKDEFMYQGPERWKEKMLNSFKSFPGWLKTVDVTLLTVSGPKGTMLLWSWRLNYRCGGAFPSRCQGGRHAGGPEGLLHLEKHQSQSLFQATNQYQDASHPIHPGLKSTQEEREEGESLIQPIAFKSEMTVFCLDLIEVCILWHQEK